MGNAFDWVDLQEGRARFVGMMRGGDDYGHSIFAVDLDGREAFGEVKATYADYDISTEIVSFGFNRPEAVGGTVGAAAYSASQAAAIERIVCELVATVARRSSNDDKPSVLATTPPARITGAVEFRAGWIRLNDVATEGRA